MNIYIYIICEHMETFEKQFLDMRPNIRFRSVKDTFQKKLKENIVKIKQSPNVFTFAGKTSNICEMRKQQHNKLLHDNVKKTYKKVPPKLKTSVNVEAKNITELINLDERIKCMVRTPAFITLKDHKPGFRQHSSCQLINPVKVSELIIEKINKKLISELHFNQ